MRAPDAGAKLALLLLLFLPPLASAACATLDVTLIANATVTQGVPASFPVVIRNVGSDLQPAYLSAETPLGLSLAFTESAYTLQQGENHTFTLTVQTDAADAKTYAIPLEVSSTEGLGACYEDYNLKLQVNPGTVPTPNPFQEAQVAISPSGPQQYFQGDQAQYQVMVTNNFDEAVILAFDSPDNLFQASTALSESAVRVPAHSVHVLKAKITIPPGAPAGTYDATFRVRVNTACCSREYLLPVTFNVYGKTAQLTFLREPLTCLPIQQDQTHVLELGVQNDGETTGPFTLETAGDESATSLVNLQMTQFELQPGQRTYFNVSITPKERTPPDYYRFTLRANYLDFTLHETAFCFQVEGTRQIDVQVPATGQVQRCATTSIPFTIRNTGSLSDTYSLQAIPLNLVRALTDPRTFTLTPGGKQQASLIVSAPCNAPLGTQALQLRIYGSGFTKTQILPLEVLPNATQQQFLKIDLPDTLEAIEGQTSEFTAYVNNQLGTSAENAQVSVEGIPAAWVEVESAKTIKSMQNAPFSIRIRPDVPGTYNVNVVVTSGLEKSAQAAQLTVAAEDKRLDYSYNLQPVSGTPQEVRVLITVKNNGNVALQGITAATNAQDVNVVPEHTIDSLAPGQSATFYAVVRPLQDTQAKSISLRLSSADGTVNAQTIAIPALTATAQPGGGFQFPWKIGAIVLLLFVIFALLSREEDPQYQV